MARMACGGGPTNAMPAAAQLRELRVLGQEAIARMNALSPRGPGHGNDALSLEIAQPGRSRSDEMGLVGVAHMQRARFGLRIDRDDAQAQPPGGAGNAAGDLAAIGDEDRREHGLLCHRAAPADKRHCQTVPMAIVAPARLG
jgi:hypothetical protein